MKNIVEIVMANDVESALKIVKRYNLKVPTDPIKKQRNILKVKIRTKTKFTKKEWARDMQVHSEFFHLFLHECRRVGLTSKINPSKMDIVKQII